MDTDIGGMIEDLIGSVQHAYALYLPGRSHAVGNEYALNIARPSLSYEAHNEECDVL